MFHSWPVAKEFFLAGSDMEQEKNTLPHVTRKHSSKCASSQMDVSQIQKVESNLCSFVQPWKPHIYKVLSHSHV